jgi:hypothetical protein
LVKCPNCNNTSLIPIPPSTFFKIKSHTSELIDKIINFIMKTNYKKETIKDTLLIALSKKIQWWIDFLFIVGIFILAHLTPISIISYYQTKSYIKNLSSEMKIMCDKYDLIEKTYLEKYNNYDNLIDMYYENKELSK